MPIIAKSSDHYDEFEEWEEVYFLRSQNRVYLYPFSMHLEKLNMSISEAMIATRQRIEREDYAETKRTVRGDQ
jgi:hypothetical protein